MSFSDIPTGWLPLLDSVVKATIVLGAAAVATSVLRRASAALRHLIWTLALVGALLMPLLSMALPRWQLPIVTVAPQEPPAIQPATPAAVERIAESIPAAPPSNPVLRSTPAAPASSGGAEPQSSSVGTLAWPQVLLTLWALGALLIVGRMIVGILAVQWMAHRGQRVLDAPWMKMAIALASEVGVTSNITFLRSERASMPMACGVLRPAVMMPAEADVWPVDRLRIVLLHELAHVRRWDCLTHLVAQVACAFHWFNPLAWLAARQVRTERERACDDLVLAAGTHGPDYADQLLEIARVMRAERYPAVLAGASLAMAHRSQLEGRLMAILDPRVPHSALTRLRASIASMACCAAVVPLAALQPWQEAAPKPPVVAAESSAQTQAPQTPTPAPAPARDSSPSVANPSTEQTAKAGSIVDAAREGTVSGTMSGTVSGTVHGTVHGTLGAIGADGRRHPTVSPGAASKEDSESDTDHDQESKASSSKADPRMLAALTAALKDSDKEVRETAMHALVQMRDPSVYEPLVQALKDVSPDVREQAAFGLGQLRDRRAVEPLTGALRDEHADVREQAAFALGQLRDRAAIPALTAALKDAAADVREQVIFALGQLRDPATLEGLSFALRDTNADVREQAAFALGQLRDRRAVEPLISALKDADADVREQAAFALGQIRDRGAVEALVIALRDANADVREQAAFALGQIRDPRAIEGLTTALKDPQASVRQQAAFALGQLAR